MYLTIPYLWQYFSFSLIPLIFLVIVFSFRPFTKMSAVDEILSQIRVGNTFATFEEVENLVSQLTKECYHPLKYVSRRTVESHNNKVFHLRYFFVK